MEFGAGNIGFMLIATALVMLMTPGLAFFYGGLVGSKNVVAVMMHSFVSLGVSTILWYAVGFSLSFSGGDGGVIGNLDWAFLDGASITDAWSGAGSIPVVLFFVYQMMFAVITPALITGAFTNRIRFGPYLAFLVLWQLLVYYPFAHMIWGGGLLADWGVLDFAGGIVVHASAGMAALGAVLYLGRRRSSEHAPHNIPFIALGTALLWVRMVRIQCRERAGGRRDHDCGIRQYTPCRIRCRVDMAGNRMANGRPTEVGGSAHRCGRWTRDHHSCSGFCRSGVGGANRARCWRSLLFRGSRSRRG